MGKTRDLLKKIRDTKGKFHANVATIKDRNGMDLTFHVPMQYCSLQHRGACKPAGSGDHPAYH